MKYPTTDCFVMFITADNPLRWRKGMFFWNGTQPIFASYGSEIPNVVDWRQTHE